MKNEKKKIFEFRLKVPSIHYRSVIMLLIEEFNKENIENCTIKRTNKQNK